MTRVLHFDHERGASEKIRNKLKEILSRYPDVTYNDFMLNNFGSFQENQGELERSLPEHDVLLIHPGPDGQRRVMEYSTLFPHLRVAFVIPGDRGDYENSSAEVSYEQQRIKFFGYPNVYGIVGFILQREPEEAYKYFD